MMWLASVVTLKTCEKFRVSHFMYHLKSDSKYHISCIILKSNSKCHILYIILSLIQSITFHLNLIQSITFQCDILNKLIARRFKIDHENVRNSDHEIPRFSASLAVFY